VERFDAEKPFRRVPAEVFTNVEEFRAAYAAAPREMQRVRVAKAG
jgi:hypothetical protein